MKSSPAKLEKIDLNIGTTKLLLGHLYTIYLKELGEDLDCNKDIDNSFLDKYMKFLSKGLWRSVVCILILTIGLLAILVISNFVFNLESEFYPILIGCVFFGFIAAFNKWFSAEMKKVQLSFLKDCLINLGGWRLCILLSLGVSVNKIIHKNELIDLISWINDLVEQIENGMKSGVEMDSGDYEILKTNLNGLRKDIKGLDLIINRGSKKIFISHLVGKNDDEIELNSNLVSLFVSILDYISMALKVSAKNMNVEIYQSVLNDLKMKNALPIFNKSSVVLSKEQIKRNEKLLKLISST